MNIRGFVGAAVVCLVSAFVGRARAEEGTPSRSAKVDYSVSLLAGYGAGERFEDDSRNRYGLALGARLGLSVKHPPRLYYGLSFLYFTGYDGPTQKVHTSTLDGELGYELRLLDDRVLIRPQVAVGVAQVATIQSDNAGYPLALHVAPGALVGVRVAPLLLSAEYRRDIVIGDWPSSNTVLFGCGLML